VAADLYSVFEMFSIIKTESEPVIKPWNIFAATSPNFTGISLNRSNSFAPGPTTKFQSEAVTLSVKTFPSFCGSS